MVMNISAFYVKTFGADGSNFCAYDGFRVGHTIANTKVAGFFNPKARDLNAGDLIMCSCLDGNAMYVVAAKPSFDGNGTPINSLIIEDYSIVATSNVGDYKKSAILTNHSGWLLCDGLAASRTVYASLFLVLGTAFGIGDGTTTFNLPDYRGRVGGSIGTGTGLTARTLGQKVGTETTILAIANLPAHTHGLLGDSASGLGSGESADRVLVNTDGQVRGVFVKNTEATGSGTAFSIMQPTLFGENTFIYAGS